MKSPWASWPEDPGPFPPALVRSLERGCSRPAQPGGPPLGSQGTWLPFLPPEHSFRKLQTRSDHTCTAHRGFPCHSANRRFVLIHHLIYPHGRPTHTLVACGKPRPRATRPRRSALTRRPCASPGLFRGSSTHTPSGARRAASIFGVSVPGSHAGPRPESELPKDLAARLHTVNASVPDGPCPPDGAAAWLRSPWGRVRV